MNNQCSTLGRMELAQLYFPYIQPHSAWKKLRSLLADDPATRHLIGLRRRTFLPSEVNIIYQHLGHLAESGSSSLTKWLPIDYIHFCLYRPR